MPRDYEASDRAMVALAGLTRDERNYALGRLCDTAPEQLLAAVEAAWQCDWIDHGDER